VKHGESIDNAIIIDTPNSILGVLEEHKHINTLFEYAVSKIMMLNRWNKISLKKIKKILISVMK
jgi:hypothetical protein